MIYRALLLWLVLQASAGCRAEVPDDAKIAAYQHLVAVAGEMKLAGRVTYFLDERDELIGSVARAMNVKCEPASRSRKDADGTARGASGERDVLLFVTDGRKIDDQSIKFIAGYNAGQKMADIYDLWVRKKDDGWVVERAELRVSA